LNRIFRAAGIAAAAATLIATAASPSIAAETQAAPAAGQFAPDGLFVDYGDLTRNAAAAAAAETPGPIGLVFQHAIARVGGDSGEAKPPPRPLAELVAAYAGDAAPDKEQECLANAVYFEARSEPMEGQLAVAEVVINRAASGRYPATLCAVITQPAQFSFIRRGRFPAVKKKPEAWRRAVAIARIARAGLAKGLASNILWYHAAYVSPRWGRRLNRETRIGLHIFYS
jgi:spore germination cell wall hydrolase CwlJ-like protein